MGNQTRQVVVIKEVDGKAIIDEKAREEEKLLKQIQGYFSTKPRKTYIKGKKVTINPLHPEQIEVLQEYYDHLYSEVEKKVGIHNLVATMRTIHGFGQFCKKPFNQVTKKDIKNYCLYQKNQGNGEVTRETYKFILKKFFEWAELTAISDHINYHRVNVRKTEEEMLTPEEILDMVKAADHPRDEALVMTFWELACRCGEGKGINIENYVPDEHGAKITRLEGKTGKRPGRLIDAVPFIQKWINCHPMKDNPKAPLFISLHKNYGRRLCENGISMVLKSLAKRARIYKRITPHVLRHSRLTHLAKQGFNEKDLRIFAGWSADSKMPDVYLHYDEKEVDRKLLRMNGKVAEKVKPSEVLKPICCPRCERSNPAGSKYCNCGMALDMKTVLKDLEDRKTYDDKMNNLMQNEKVRKAITEALMAEENKK